MNTVPVIHFGLGPIGRLIGQHVAEEGWLESVGAVDIDPEIVGRTLPETCDASLPPVSVVSSLEEVKTPAGAVVLQATVSQLAEAKPQLIEAIARGYHVVSTCEELVWPWSDHPELAHEIDEAARAAGVTVLGVGVNPGFVMDALPVLISRANTEIEAVHVARFVDVTERRIPLQKKMGLGMEPATVQKLLDEKEIGHVGLKASVQMLAAGLDWRLSVIDIDSHPIVAEEPTETGLGLIPEGRCIGISQQATGYDQLIPRITLKLDMQAHLPGGSRDEIFVDGKQGLRVRIDGLHGDHATAALVVNQAIRVRAMPAGLQTMLSAPLAA